MSNESSTEPGPKTDWREALVRDRALVMNRNVLRWGRVTAYFNGKDRIYEDKYGEALVGTHVLLLDHGDGVVDAFIARDDDEAVYLVLNGPAGFFLATAAKVIRESVVGLAKLGAASKINPRLGALIIAAVISVQAQALKDADDGDTPG